MLVRGNWRIRHWTTNPVPISSIN